MARKRRGRRHGLPKTVGGWVGLTLKAVGAITVASPAIQGVVGGMQSGNPANIPKNVVFGYTGYAIDTGNINWTQTGVGVGTVAVGILLAKLGGVVGRMVR